MAQTTQEINAETDESSPTTHTHTHVVRLKGKSGPESLIALALIFTIFAIWLVFKSYQLKKLRRKKQNKKFSKKGR